MATKTVTPRMAASMQKAGMTPSGGKTFPTSTSTTNTSPQFSMEQISAQAKLTPQQNLSIESAKKGNVGSTVNAKGQLVDSTGKVLGSANPLDTYSSTATQGEGEQPTVPGQQTQPTTAQQGIVPYDQAVKNLQAGGLQGEALAGATQSLKNAYQGRLEAVKSAGLAAPTSAGQAMTAVQATAPTQQAEPSFMGGIMETDSNFDSILTNFDKVFSPPEQKKSLVEEYQGLSKALGIEQINAELVDAKKIIEGTEDDIRAEVTATGGFATDSQVMALANARNKTLIKNYNALLDTRDNAMTQLGTMMNLTIEDRKMAQAEFDRKLDYAFKVADFKQKATDNARQTYLSLGDKMGWDTLLTSVSPYEKGIIQKTLGVSGQALDNLATQSQLSRAQKNTEQALDIELKRSQIAKNREGTKSVKPPTQEQLKVAGYKDRLVESNKVIGQIGGKFTGAGSYLGGILPNLLKSGERQLFEQAQRNFINAVLRRESGASISPQEFDNARQQYFPQPGDSSAVIQQKAANRSTIISGFIRESGNSPTSQYIVAPDGQEIEIID